MHRSHTFLAAVLTLTLLTACQSAPTRPIDPPVAVASSSSSSSLALSSEASSSSWQTMTHTKYHYSINYPSDCQISGGDYAVTDPTIALSVYVCKLHIDTQDPASYNSEMYPHMKLTGKAFAEGTWKMNAEDDNPYVHGKEVSGLQEVSVNGHEAYRFTVTKSYGDAHQGFLLEEPLQVTMLTHDNVNFVVFAPVNDAQSEAVLQTLTFAK